MTADQAYAAAVEQLAVLVERFRATSPSDHPAVERLVAEARNALQGALLASEEAAGGWS